jgi:translocation and assembly module TamA
LSALPSQGRERPVAPAAAGLTTLLLAVALLPSACSHEQKPPDEPVVRKLSIEGTKHVSEGALKAGIATTATGWWWPFAKKHYYDPFTWQTDLRRIERIYQAHGFFEARVVSNSAKPVKNGVELTAAVREGNPTTVASFDVQGLDGLTEEQRSQVLKGVRWQGTFTDDKWGAAKATIADRLRNLGYAKASVEGRVLVDVREQVADVLVVVQTGPRYRFGAIRVHQDPSHRLWALWMWEQARRAIPKDAYYSEDLLAEAQRRVAGMGLFSVVKVTAGEPDPASDRIPVVVDVHEAPLRTLRVGFGVEFDQVRDEARLIGEWSHLDFLGAMRRLTIHGEAGWAFIPNVYAVARNDTASGPRNGPIGLLRTDLEQPRFFGRASLRGKVTVSAERTLEQAYDAVGAKGATGVSWQPRSWLSLYASYNLQGYYLNGPAISSVSAAPLTLGCVSQTASCFVLLSYLEQIATVDRRDSPFEPHTGYFASISFQEGGGPLGGDFTYLRILPDVRGYLSFDDFTLGARLRFGELLHTGAQSAVVTRFFSGGGVSMRGFSDRRLSPLLLAPAPATQLGTSATLSLPIGGNGLIEGNVEARWQLTRNLIAAVFFDFGQVTTGTIGPGDLASILGAVGIGMRYRTAIGPVRIDIARRLPFGRPPPLYTIDPDSGAVAPASYQVNDDCFGLGGSGRATPVTDSSCVFHVAIGEAF